VADRLAQSLGIAATHLDDLHWEPGWVERSWDDLAHRVAPIVAGDAWVMDGNYSDVRTKLDGRVELYVWLDLPWTTTFARVLRRSWRRAVSGEPCCNGNRETLGRVFLSTDSILLWSVRTRWTRRRDYAAELAGRPHVRLRTPREVEAFLAAAAPGPVAGAP
jgi:adenylate kinase family enzyme